VITRSKPIGPSLPGQAFEPATITTMSLTLERVFEALGRSFSPLTANKPKRQEPQVRCSARNVWLAPVAKLI